MKDATSITRAIKLALRLKKIKQIHQERTGTSPTKFRDLTGMRFGMWTVMRYLGKSPSKKHTQWVAKCDCGHTKTLRGDNLMSKKTYSCGCKRRYNPNAQKRGPKPKHISPEEEESALSPEVEEGLSEKDHQRIGDGFGILMEDI